MCWIERKARSGRMSAAQASVASHLVAAGHGYLCSADYRDIVETLKGWGAAIRDPHAVTTLVAPKAKSLARNNKTGTRLFN